MKRLRIQLMLESLIFDLRLPSIFAMLFKAYTIGEGRGSRKVVSDGLSPATSLLVDIIIILLGP